MRESLGHAGPGDGCDAVVYALRWFVIRIIICVIDILDHSLLRLERGWRELRNLRTEFLWREEVRLGLAEGGERKGVTSGLMSSSMAAYRGKGSLRGLGEEGGTCTWAPQGSRVLPKGWVHSLLPNNLNYILVYYPPARFTPAASQSPLQEHHTLTAADNDKHHHFLLK